MRYGLKMSRKPLWQTDKSRQKCEISGCNYTSERDFGVCFKHRIIAFNEIKGYDIHFIQHK